MSTAAPTSTQSSKPSDYAVAKPLGRCAITAQPIEPGTRFMAALRETSVGFERLDIVLEAWPQFDRKDVIGFWQAVMPSAEQKKKPFVDDQVLCELFERLATVSEPAKLNFRFVLGLILMRKRMLIYESSRRDEGSAEVWSVRFKGREDRLDLVNPRLTEEQVKEVSGQLGEILNDSL